MIRILLVILSATCVTQVAYSAPARFIPQDQMDQLNRFFTGTVTATNGVLIDIGQAPTTTSPDAKKMAQMLAVCQVKKQIGQYSCNITIGGANCPVGYFIQKSTRPEADGSLISSAVERNKIGSDYAKILTGLSDYSTAGSLTTTTLISGAFTSQGGSRRKFVSADGSNTVAVQVTSTISGINTNAGDACEAKQTVASDKEDYTIVFGSQTYTAEKLTTGANSTCSLNGISSSCSDFDYIMGLSSSR